MVDISGKVLNYDIALCEALSRTLPSNDHLKLLAPNIKPEKIDCNCKRLISLIPKSLKNSENNVKRGIKAFEGLANYIYLILYLTFHKVEVLHLQWLPFLEICSIEKFFLIIIKHVSPHIKVILTVHNLYPHNSIESKKIVYRSRFNKIQKYIDKYILHLEVTRKDFCRDFCIEKSKTAVIPHGIFEPQKYVVQPHVRGEKLNLIMYGNQSYYKGTDILVDALNLLSKECQEKIHTVIVGKIAPDYYASLKKKTEKLDVEWIPEFVSDDVLYKKIEESDVIVIPYREISQSGVLLLALSFKRSLIVSDLPSFKETLVGFSDEIFFEKDKADSLAEVIQSYAYGLVNLNGCLFFLHNLCDELSWERIAKRTLIEYGEKQ